MSPELENYLLLLTALAIGMLIGVERGWHEREHKEGERIAGIRTYGILGLLGGIVALLTGKNNVLLQGLTFVAIAFVWSIAYVMNFTREKDASITGLIAGLLTYTLGVAAGLGYIKEASAAAVVTAILLGFKPELHNWVQQLKREELQAGFKMLIISVVLLPVLPNKDYGPWGALNPYEIWWMVVIIALISFVGYFAVKIAGTRRGILYTGLFAGLSSSTAVTLHFSSLVKQNTQIEVPAATGVLLASATMFPRALAIVSIFNHALFVPLLKPVIVMSVIVYGVSVYFWRRQLKIAQPDNQQNVLRNPLNLGVALRFGLLLSAILLLSKGLQHYFGDAGMYALSGLSGMVDVDAISLSMARMNNNGDIMLTATVIAITLALASNSVVKGVYALSIGGMRFGAKVALPLVVAAAAGVAVVLTMG